MLEVKTSRNLNVPFIEVDKDGEKAYLCENGILFTDAEYQEGIDIASEYKRRIAEGEFYDFNYAKDTGVLRRKKMPEIYKETYKGKQETADREKDRTLILIILLGFTSVISMYISTLHTATYLKDYADILSSWFMSASVTAYNSTAFEVSVIFKQKDRYLMSCVFMFLWVIVTLFSMATTVSVFYDSFNFNEYQIQTENKKADAGKLELEILHKKEFNLREAISFKKKDIEYRQKRNFATTAVREELNKLQEELQENLTQQQRILSEIPEVMETNKTKESLFAFLGRLFRLESGIFEFIMSTLSAVFVNLISPLSLTAVIELLKKENKDLTNQTKHSII